MATFIPSVATLHQPPRPPQPRTHRSPPPVTLSNLTLSPPLILAPMAGVTNPPFRELCRAHGASLTISEMLHAFYYLSNRIVPTFHADEPRSVQLYGTDADTLSAAAARLVRESAVQHIDLNFGCPAPKILRRGGGAAVPGDHERFRAIVEGVVESAAGVGVTVKLRAGYGGQETYLTAGRIAQEAGVGAVILHARLAEELYDRGLGRAGWYRIARLVRELDIPVFGNGDVFTGDDARDMVTETGCAGVVVGRGCLGRPWLFDDIRDAVWGEGEGEGEGVTGVTAPEVGTVLGVMLRLVEGVVRHGISAGMDERRAVFGARKWYAWFLQGYLGTEELVEALKRADGIGRVRQLVEGFGGDVVVDMDGVTRERGKLGRE